MSPFYAAMLEGFERRDPAFDINVGNLPYCILPAWGSYIHHGGEPTVTKSSDATGLEDAKNKYDWHESMRTHLPGCAECVFRPSCTGIFRAYLEIYGGDEFQPVSHEALLQIDPGRRNLVRLIDPLLAPLRSASRSESFLPSWRLHGETSEHRRQSVELRFVHESGAATILRWLRPGHSQEPVLATTDYDLEAEADVGAPTKAVEALLNRTRTLLAGTCSTVPMLAADAIDRARRGGLLSRGRARVHSIAARLGGRFTMPGWHLEPLRWPARRSAELPVRGPGGARVDLIFALGAVNGRSQVDLDFRLSDDCDQDTARMVIERLTSLLRTGPSSTSAA
jgi:hypothetical protein